MKLKNLRKKIRRLEKRLKEGPEKLARLRRKLKALEARNASSARARAARKAVKRLKPAATKAPIKIAGTKKPAAAKTVKRKLNLSSERRAQLAAAMKARW